MKKKKIENKVLFFAQTRSGLFHAFQKTYFYVGNQGPSATALLHPTEFDNHSK